MARALRAPLACWLLSSAAAVDDLSLMQRHHRGGVDGAEDVLAEAEGPAIAPGSAGHGHGHGPSMNPMDMYGNFMKQMQSFMPAMNGNNGMGNAMMDWWSNMGKTFATAAQSMRTGGSGGSGLPGGSGAGGMMDAMQKNMQQAMMGGSGAAMGPVAHMSEGRRLLAEKELSASLDSTNGVMQAAWRMNERTWKIMAMWPMALAALPMVQQSGDKFVDQLGSWGRNAQLQLTDAVAKSEQSRTASAQQVRDNINKMSEGILHQFQDFSHRASGSGADLGPMLMMGTATLPHLPGMKPLTDMMDNFQNMFKVGSSGGLPAGLAQHFGQKGSIGQGVLSLSDWLLKVNLQMLSSATEQVQRNMMQAVQMARNGLMNMNGNDKMSANPQFQIMKDHFLNRLGEASQFCSAVITQVHELIQSGSVAVNQQVRRSFPDGEFQPTIAHLRGRLGGLTAVLNELNVKWFEIGSVVRQGMMNELGLFMNMLKNAAQSTANMDERMSKQVNNYIQSVDAMMALLQRLEANQVALQRRMVEFGNNMAAKTASIVAGDAEQIQEATKMLDEIKEAVADLRAQDEALRSMQELHRQTTVQETLDTVQFMGKEVDAIKGYADNMGQIFNMQQPMMAMNKIMTDGYNQWNKAMQMGMQQFSEGTLRLEDAEQAATQQVTTTNNLLEGQRNFVNMLAEQFAAGLTSWENTYAKGNPMAQQFVNNIRQSLAIMQKVVAQFAEAAHRMTENAGMMWKMPGMQEMSKFMPMTQLADYHRQHESHHSDSAHKMFGSGDWHMPSFFVPWSPDSNKQSSASSSR